jgi:Bifunctional DNA primase/polymerase, N-terminal
MLDNCIYIQERVSEYIGLGFAPIPIWHKTKQPINKNWTELRVSADNVEKHFGGFPKNIGILTGAASKGSVDVDIDNIDALRFAPRFLPLTNCIFGRESKQKSHWVYRVNDPATIQPFQSDGMIVEIRGNGRHTVFPGSIHQSGEPIEFENRNNFEPSLSNWTELVRAGAKIAMATLLLEAWTPGQRHELALATAAVLARAGWRRDEVRHLIEAIALEAKDEELADWPAPGLDDTRLN